MKKKFWVSMVKYAGVEIEAEDEEQASEIAKAMDESQYEFDQFNENEWQLFGVEEIED